MTTPEYAVVSLIGGVELFFRFVTGKIGKNDITRHGNNVFRKKIQ